MALYALRDYKVLQCFTGICILSGTWVGGLAFIPDSMYNGKRGFIKTPSAKYLMYAVYLVHMLIIYFIKLKTGAV